MTLVSYARNHEDVLLARLFPPGVPGFFVDVGAMDPVLDSVTKLFSDRGWQGVNVEPAMSLFERLQAARPRDVCLNVALSDDDGGEDLDAGGASPPDRSVPVMTLAQVCQKYVTDTIDFLSIRVDGHERQVIAGGDWRTWRPRVVLVEATKPDTTLTTHHPWEDLLLGADYVFAAFDGLNRVYVRVEDEHLAAALAAPVNVLDDYVPHRYESQIAELTSRLGAAERQLAASRALNATISAEHAALLTDVASLRPAYRELQDEVLLLRDQYTNVLASTRVHYASVKESVLSSSVGIEQLRIEVADARERTDAVATLFDNIGQAGLGIARRLTKLSGRHPAAATLSKRALETGLRLQRAVKRSET
jgi:FkbM family methyltransferase